MIHIYFSSESEIFVVSPLPQTPLSDNELPDREGALCVKSNAI